MYLTESQRLKILELRSKSYKVNYIADFIGCCSKTVTNTLERMRPRTNEPGRITNLKRTGPRKVNQQMVSNMVEYVTLNKYCTLNKIKQDLQLPITIRTISVKLRENGIRSYRCNVKPFINFSNRIRRLSFADVLVNWPLHNFQRLIFLDEKTFTTKSKNVQMIKRKRGEKNIVDNITHQSNLTEIKINTICMIKYNTPILIKKVSNNLDGEEFAATLEELLDDFDGETFIYLDNCPIHKSPPALTYLINHPNIKFIKTPAVSPDLNCIENLFFFLDRKLGTYLFNNFIQSENELYQTIINLAEEIPISTINKLINSMPDRIKSCQMNFGRSTKY